MLKEKTNRWFLALGAALLCAGLGAAALWDLEIDLALYSPGFLPAVLMEAFGWFPQYLPAVVLCVCIALDGARSMPLRAAGGLLAVAGSGILLYMGAHHLVKRGMSGPSITLWTVLLGGLSLGICALALYRSRSGGRKKLEFVCLWGTVYLLAGLAAINIIKAVWKSDALAARCIRWPGVQRAILSRLSGSARAFTTCSPPRAAASRARSHSLQAGCSRSATAVPAFRPATRLPRAVCSS